MLDAPVRVSVIWNCTGYVHPPPLELIALDDEPLPPVPAAFPVAELSVTALPPSTPRNCSIVCATADCEVAQPES